mgnify:FL=1
MALTLPKVLTNGTTATAADLQENKYAVADYLNETKIEAVNLSAKRHVHAYSAALNLLRDPALSGAIALPTLCLWRVPAAGTLYWWKGMLSFTAGPADLVLSRNTGAGWAVLDTMTLAVSETWGSVDIADVALAAGDLLRIGVSAAAVTSLRKVCAVARAYQELAA